MRNINQTLVIAMIATVYTIVFTPYLFAQNTSDSPNMPAAASSDRSIGEFLTPDGRFNSRCGAENRLSGFTQYEGFSITY